MNPLWTIEDQRRYGSKAITPLSLLRELCAAFHASEKAMLCVMSHGQLTIDGYVIRPEHLRRWPPDRLKGRYAVLAGRTVQLYGTTPVERLVDGG